MSKLSIYAECLFCLFVICHFEKQVVVILYKYEAKYCMIVCRSHPYIQVCPVKFSASLEFLFRIKVDAYTVKVLYFHIHIHKRK